MHRHVVTTDVSTSARECARLIASERIGCVVVEERGKPLGMITERSFVHLVAEGKDGLDRVRAKDFMSSPLIALGPGADFAEAMRVFNTKNIKRIPVVSHGKVIGLLSLKDMVAYSNLALTTLDKRHEELKSQSATDALTGVLSKRAVTAAVRREFERVNRYGGRSSVLFIDIDHFKAVNDRYSHLGGDAVLKQMGKLLKGVCREIDTIGRFGGEEFVIIAPNRKKYHAVKFGGRLRRAVEEHVFRYGKTEIRITASIGIASLFEGRDVEAALERADKALYHAKESGRNRIGLWRVGKLAIARIDGEEF